jgi:hypothetical protein
MATWRDVSGLTLALPQTSEERSADGRRTWKVATKSFAWERPLRRADLVALGDNAPAGAILGVRTEDLEMKQVLIASDPRVFFTTPHFDGYAAVLIQLDPITPKKLKDVLVEAWLSRAPKRAAAAFLSHRAPDDE